MNIKQLKELIRLFEESTLSELEISEGGEQVRLKRAVNAPETPAPLSPSTASAAPVPSVPSRTDDVDFNRVIEVPSPVVGVFYEAPEPGGKPFVKLGDKVQRGDVLCLIEVMKQVTEVTAPQSGQVIDICVTNGSVVEFGQTLVKLC